MKSEKTQYQYFLRHIEVSQISSREIPASITPAIVVNRTLILRVPGIFYNQFSVTCKESAVPRVPRGYDAIEEIYPRGNRLSYVPGLPDAHEITRFFRGKGR